MKERKSQSMETERDFIECKNKNCGNPVISGEYCEHCKKGNNEVGEGIMKTVLAIVGIIVGKSILKQIKVEKLIRIASKLFK